MKLGIMVLHRLKERIVKQVLSHNLFSNFYPLLPFMRLETEAACTKMLPNYLLKKDKFSQGSLQLPWEIVPLIGTKSLALFVC